MRPFSFNYHSIQLYKPRDLDLARLVKNAENSALSIWLSEKRPIRLKDGSTKILPFNLAKLFLFCTKLLEQTTFQKTKTGERPYFNLSNDTLAKFFDRNDISKVIGVLVELNVIEVNSAYSTGRFSRSYRFTKEYAFSELAIIDSELGRCFGKRVVENWRKRVHKSCNPRDDFHRWLVGCMKLLRLRTEAQTMLVGEKPSLVDPTIMDGWSFKRDETERAKSDAIAALDRISQWASANDPRFPNHVVLFKPSDVTGRVYTNITQLKREARRYLLYRNAPLKNIDANAAHPFLLLKFYEHFALGQVRERRAEAKKYFSLWQLKDAEGNRDFYANFKSLTGMQATRSEMKASFLEDFVNIKKSRKLGKDLAKAYQTHFPLLVQQMDRIKSEQFFPSDDPFWTAKRANGKHATNHGQMAVLLQRWESQVVIEQAAREIHVTERFWITSVHDALLCQSRYADKAKSAIVKAFKEFVGYKPNVKIESLMPHVSVNDS